MTLKLTILVHPFQSIFCSQLWKFLLITRSCLAISAIMAALFTLFTDYCNLGYYIDLKRRKTFFLLVSFFAQEESTRSIRGKYSSTLAVVFRFLSQLSNHNNIFGPISPPLTSKINNNVYIVSVPGKEAIKLQISPEYIIPFSGAIPSCSKKLSGSLAVLNCNKNLNGISAKSPIMLFLQRQIK